MRKYVAFLLVLSIFVTICPFTYAEDGVRDFCNVVFFARFADDNENLMNTSASDFSDESVWQHIKNDYNGNGNSSNNNIDTSFRAYITAISYGKLNVTNVFPQEYYSDENSRYELLPFTLAHELDYYTDSLEIVSEISAALANGILTLPAECNTDLDNDGYVDNLTVVLQASDTVERDNRVIYPHKAPAFGYNYSVGGNEVGNYNILNTYTLLDGLNAQGVTSHEFLHSLGLPDLYRNSGKGVPVGTWDIMANASSYQAYPLAYMRSTLGWLDIAEVSSTVNNFTLDVATMNTGKQAVILKTPMSDNEFFVIEYRKVVASSYAGLGFDTKLWASGLIIYRVNNALENRSNFAGENYIYLFRRGETTLSDALCEPKANAVIAPFGDDPLTSYGSSDMEAAFTENTIFYADGRNSGITIENITGDENGSSISFDIVMPDYSSMNLWSQLGDNLKKYCDSFDVEFDTVGTPYTAFCSNDNYPSDIFLARMSADGWQYLTSPGKGTDSSLCLFSDIPYICYTGSDGTTVYIKKYQNGSWQNIGSYTGSLGLLASDGVNIFAAVTSEKSVNLYNITTASPVSAGVYNSADQIFNPSLAIYRGSPIYAFSPFFSSDTRTVLVSFEGESPEIFARGSSSGYNTTKLAVNGDRIYLLSGSNSYKPLLEVYDGNKWTSSFVTDDTSYTEITISLSDSRVYVGFIVGETARVYYSSDNGSFIKLYSDVTTSASDLNIKYHGGILYAGCAGSSSVEGIGHILTNYTPDYISKCSLSLSEVTSIGFSASVSLPNNCSGKLVMAVYRGDKMLSCKLNELSTIECRVVTLSYEDALAAGDSVKISFIDSIYSPLCSSVASSLT